MQHPHRRRRPFVVSSSLAVFTCVAGCMDVPEAATAPSEADAALVAPATLTSLTGLAGSPNMLYSYGVSPDGDMVLGEAWPTDGVHGEGLVAVRASDGPWSVRSLGVFATTDSHYSPAFSASRAGLVVGVGSMGDPAVDAPYIWSAGKSLRSLGLFAGDTLGFARGISSSGSTVVGWGITARTSHWSVNDPYRHALRWTPTGSGPVLIDTAANAPAESMAMSASSDGKIITGFATSAASIGVPFSAPDSRGHEAIVWTLKNGAYQRAWLGFLPGLGNHSRGHAISEKGDRVVGFSGVYGTSHPTLWKFDTKKGWLIRDLGILPGYEAGGASAISPDGTVVVGSCYRSSNGDFAAEAFIWTERTGMRTVASALAAAGANVTGWTFIDATGVTTEHNVIVGTGIDPQGNFTAWVATLP